MFHWSAISTCWSSSACPKRADLREQRLFGRVQVPDVVDDPAGVAEAHLLLAAGTLVDEVDLEALVQEGHHLQAFDDRLGPELDLFEPCGVRPEA